MNFLQKLVAIMFFIAATLFLAFFVMLKKHNQPTVFTHHLIGWYQTDPLKLDHQIKLYLEFGAQNLASNVPGRPKVAIVPHAGHKFSGIAAGSVYNQILQSHLKQPYERIIILTPNHSGQLDGFAMPTFDLYKMPTQTISIDQKTIKNLQKTELIKICDDLFAQEHSLEIQLPFLGLAAEKTKILPILVGNLDKKPDYIEQLTKIIDGIVKENDFLLISTDLTHYGPNYDFMPFSQNSSLNVKNYDRELVSTILENRPEDFDSFIKLKNPTICGKNPIKLMLELLKTNNQLKNLEGRLICYYSSLNAINWQNFWPNSIDQVIQTKKSKTTDSFVSYAGIIFYKPENIDYKIENEFSDFEKATLKEMALYATHKAVLKNKPANLKQFRIGTGTEKKMGVFITLKDKNNNLRGCIGQIETDKPLYKTISQTAFNVCFNDNRFPPVRPEKLSDLKITLSILSKPRPIDSYNEIILGRHGIILEKTVQNTEYSALFLPEVATEFGWTLNQTLSNLSEKANLDPKDWKSNCKFKVFETLKI